MFDDQIGLRPISVTVVREAPGLSLVGPMLGNLLGHPGFEDRAAQRVCVKLVGIPDAQ